MRFLKAAATTEAILPSTLTATAAALMSKPIYIKRSTGNVQIGQTFISAQDSMLATNAFKPGGAPFASSSDSRTKTMCWHQIS